LVIGIERSDAAFCPSNKAIEVMGFQESLSEVWTVIPTDQSRDSVRAGIEGACKEE
jgi:hypothetical protein